MTNPQHPQSLAVPVEPSDHRQGAEHAPVTLIEYGDFECPSCRVAAPTIPLLLERHANKIRFVYRHFPIEDAHPHALGAAQAAEAAGAQGRFWPMHDLLFQNQAHLKGKDLVRYAASLGLDLTRFNADVSGQVYLQRIREQIEGGRRSHLRATPTFFLNGVLVDVSYGMQSLHDAVDAAVRSTARSLGG